MSCAGCMYTIKTKKDAEVTCPMTYTCNTSTDKPTANATKEGNKKRIAQH